jgi:predicted dehydrogenase
VIKLALVGCGNWGKNYLESTALIDGVSITTICDFRLSEIDSGIGAIRDYREIKDVDGVIVATPPETHREITCFFLKAEIPVLVEKPIALNQLDVDAIFAASLLHKTPVLINNIHLFSSAFELLREDIKKWEESLTISSIGGNIGPYRDYSALFDYGPHDIAMCLSLLDGYPDNIEILKGGSGTGEVYTVMLNQGKHRATLTFGSGLVKKERRFRVVSHSHQAVHNDLIENKLVLDGMVCPIDGTPPLVCVLHTFAEYIKNKTITWQFSHDLNLDVMNVIEECRLMLLNQYPDLRDKLELDA